MSKEFKPLFSGYMKIYLHDDIPERLASRAEFTQDWRMDQKRHKIMKRDRKFQITLHIFDKDGFKRGLESMVFMSRGNHKDLSKVIFEFGNKFVDELREKDCDVDLINSYAVVRV